MKKLFAIFVEHFRRFAGNSPDNESASTQLLPSSASHNIPAATEMRSAPARQSAPPLSRANRMTTEFRTSGGSSSRPHNSSASVQPDFVTREELKRELDLIRRLIESRK